MFRSLQPSSNRLFQILRWPSNRRLVGKDRVNRQLLRIFQNKVFGTGYPSLPTMTQEEYFEKELREGKIVAEFR